MAENNGSNFLTYARLTGILLSVMGVLMATMMLWLKANIDANTNRIQAIEIQQAQFADLRERVKTQELAQVALQAQVAASISQVAQNLALMDVYKKEIDNLYRVNGLREVRRGR